MALTEEEYLRTDEAKENRANYKELVAKSNGINLWLDDVRKPERVGPIWAEDWTWAKTAEEAIELLKTGRVKTASLDHDLGEGLTGYDVMLWLEEHLGELPELPLIVVHSMNPVGKERMQRLYDRLWFDKLCGEFGW